MDRRFAWLSAPLLLVAGCQLVAGLGDATPLTEASATTSGTGNGGNGGASASDNVAASTSIGGLASSVGGAGGLSSGIGGSASGGGAMPNGSGTGGGAGCGGAPGIIAAVAAGAHHTCAAVDVNSGADVDIYCWGDGSQAQLGGGTAQAQSSTPVKVDTFPGSTLASIAANADFTCAAPDAGTTVTCWGSNVGGPIDPTQNTGLYMPASVIIPGTTASVKALFAGDNFACAKMTDNALYCWGTINGTRMAPTKVATSVGNVTAGAHHVCYVVGNAIDCFGLNDDGQCGALPGNPNLVPYSPPVAVAASAPGALAAGADFTCGEMSSTWLCWGSNQGGVLDLSGMSMNTETATSIPSPYNGGVGSAGNDFVCVIAGDGDIHCWGDNAVGQLGKLQDPSTLSFGGATGIASGYSATGMSPAEHTCAWDDTTIQCWGSNDSGECGVDLPSPIAFGAKVCWAAP